MTGGTRGVLISHLCTEYPRDAASYPRPTIEELQLRNQCHHHRTYASRKPFFHNESCYNYVTVRRLMVKLGSHIIVWTTPRRVYPIVLENPRYRPLACGSLGITEMMPVLPRGKHKLAHVERFSLSIGDRSNVACSTQLKPSSVSSERITP